MYSAITYLVSFIAMGVLLFFWGDIWVWVSPMGAGLGPDPNAVTDPTLGLVAMVTMFAITLVVLTRQGENFRKIKTGEAKKMKLWKIFKGKADEALK